MRVSQRQPSPRQIELAMSEAMQVKAAIGDDPDLKLLADMIDGETAALDIIDRLAEQYKADALVCEVARKRARRLEARADKARELADRMLEALGLDAEALERALYTADYVNEAAGAVIENEAIIPRAYMRPDKTEIAKALRKGTKIKGAMLGNPGRHLVFRFT